VVVVSVVDVLAALAPFRVVVRFFFARLVDDRVDVGGLVGGAAVGPAGGWTGISTMDDSTGEAGEEVVGAVVLVVTVEDGSSNPLFAGPPTDTCALAAPMTVAADAVLSTARTTMACLNRHAANCRGRRLLWRPDGSGR
jgi:hypothetical protein